MRKDRGGEFAVLLLEVLSRIELPPLDEVPNLRAVETAGLTGWTVPNTEIAIVRTEEGPYAGELQFSAAPVARLPNFYERSRHLPYKPGFLVGIYEDIIFSPGPWLSPAWTSNLPRFAYVVVLGQTIWQWLAAFAALALAAAVIIRAYLWGRRLDRAGGESDFQRHVGRLLVTILAIPLIDLTARFLDDGINLTGTALFVLRLALGVVEAGAIGWLITLVLKAIGEAIIRLRRSRPESINAQLVRIVVRLLAIVVLIYLALYVAESFGVPAAPLIASLGVGGLAIALAVRPTSKTSSAGSSYSPTSRSGSGNFACSATRWARSRRSVCARPASAASIGR